MEQNKLTTAKLVKYPMIALGLIVLFNLAFMTSFISGEYGIKDNFEKHGFLASNDIEVNPEAIIVAQN